MPRFNTDFSGVTDGFSLPAEGPHVGKITKVTLEDGTKAKYLKWIIKIAVGEDKGSEVTHITSLSAAALFNLRNTLIACGLDVPKSKFQVNTDLCIGKIVGFDIAHQEYEKDGEKKKSAKIVEIYAVEKGPKGFVKKGATAAPKVDDLETDEPPFNTMEDDLLDDIEEIDI